MNIRTALKSVGMGILVMAFGSIALSQEKTGLPEFFGFYAISDGQNIAIYEGQGAEGTKTARVVGYQILQNSKFQDTRPQISASARFILFYSNSGEMIQSLSLYRLPLVRNIIEKLPAVALTPPSRRVVDSPNVPLLARIPELAFRLLAKPVPNQPQMVELVASPKLTPGLYVIEYSPSGKEGWFTTFTVTSASETETPYCLDLILPGGQGGVFFRANSELAAPVPLLAAYDYSQCNASGVSGGNSGATTSNDARTSTESNTTYPGLDPIPWTDPATGLKWTRADNDANITWNEAVEYCQNLRLGGTSGWRLPEIDELKGLFDRSANVPPAPRPELAGMNIQFGPNHIKGHFKLSGLELSNTSKPPADILAFDFQTGKERSIKSGDKKWRERALCVRNP